MEQPKIGTDLQMAEALLSHLREGISLLLSRWTGLQMAVKNEWGGHDSLHKSKQLATDILSCFFQSNGLYILSVPLLPIFLLSTPNSI